METVTFEAFASSAVLAVADSDRLGDARSAVESVVADFDRACSRFRDDSELCAVNAATGQWMGLSPLLMEAIQAALRAAELTDGDVDPTVGQALITLGYDRDYAALSDSPRPSPRPLAQVPGWRTVQLDRKTSSVKMLAGVSLDLGATAKALAADHAAAAAARAGGCGVLVSFGGDLATAGSPPEDGWLVRVTDDHRAGLGAPGQWITLRSGGLATSSTTVRRWRTESGTAHHLVNPATGAPTDGPWRTVSVTAASCLDANIASTAAVIRGFSAPDWLREQGLPSRLVTTEGTVHHLAGWPQDGDDLPPATPTPQLAGRGTP